MPSEKDLMELPKNEIAKLATRARSALKKNVTRVANAKGAAIHSGTSIVAAAAMGYWNGGSLKAARDAGEDETEALQWGGIDREAIVAGLTLVGGFVLSAQKKDSTAAQALIGAGTGIGSFYIGNYMQDMAEEDDAAAAGA